MNPQGFSWIADNVNFANLDVLDAGTGKSSCAFLIKQNPKSLTLISLQDDLIQKVKELIKDTDFPCNVIKCDISHNSPGQYDFILADYLLGAIDGHAVYHQCDVIDTLYNSLKPEGKIAVIGWEPLEKPRTPAQSVLYDMYRLRDSIIYLAGSNYYREYPQWWVTKRMIDCGFKIIKTYTYTNVFSLDFLNSCMNVIIRWSRRYPSASLREAYIARASWLMQKAGEMVEFRQGFEYGHDYVILAIKLVTSY